MDEQAKFELRKVLKWGGIVLVLLGVFLVAETLNALKDWRSVNPVYNSISVMGKGEATTQPDVAKFSFTVTAEAKAVSDAQSAVTTKMNGILADLKALGIEEKDIDTSDYSVWPKYRYEAAVCMGGMCPPSNPVADGYTANHTVTVTVRKTDDAGKALSAVGAKGATNISGLNFTTDDPDKALAEARAKAVEDAKTKAEALADSLGVRLIRVVGYYDNTGYPTPMYARTEAGFGGMDSKSAVPAPTLPMGEGKITASVTVNFEIR